MSDSSILHVAVVAYAHKKIQIGPDVQALILSQQHKIDWCLGLHFTIQPSVNSIPMSWISSTLPNHLLIVDLLNLLLSLSLLQGGSKRVEAQLWFHLQFFKVLQHQLRELLAFLFKLRSKRICLMVS